MSAASDGGGRVASIRIAPVKGLRVLERESVEVGPGGVREDRRFLVVDADGRMANGKRFGSLQAIGVDYSDARRELTLEIPGRGTVSEPVELGDRVAVRFFSSTIATTEVLGPWSQALSDYTGAALRLVEAEPAQGAVDRRHGGAVSLIASESVRRVGAAAGADGPVDARRFRMLFEIDGVAAHAEDGWLDRAVRIGGATVMPRGHVGRCLVTTLDPDTGVRDLETLDALASYRSDAGTTEPLACGVFGVVLEPGPVRLGDTVTPT